MKVSMFLTFCLTMTSTLSSAGEDHYIYNAGYRQQLNELVKQYAWARKEKKRILSLADKIVKIDNNDLWVSIPSQMVPRASYVNRKWGCPKCGPAIFKTGYYPWIKLHGQWKLQCPTCKEKFPKNDFYKYYLSGIDRKGNFNPDKADKSLLFNTEHPDPKDPLHKFGVDDGTGYVRNGNEYYAFIAHYNLNSNWHSGGSSGFNYRIDNPLDKALALGFAYAYTEKPVYAEKAAVILDRFADLYPDFDLNYWARRGYKKDFWTYGNSQGKTCDDIWSSINSRKPPVIYGLIYDGVKNNPPLYAFLRNRAKKYDLRSPKGTFKDFTRNVEQNIFAHGLDCFKKRIIVGNTGFMSRAVMLMALVARDTEVRNAIIEFLISPPLEHKTAKNTFNYPHIMGIDILGEAIDITRDGFSWEGGFGYISIAPKSLTANYPAMQLLEQKITDQDLKKQFKLVNPLLKDRLIRYYYNACQTVCLGKYAPNFGDGGKFGVGYIPYGATYTDLGAGLACIKDKLLARLYLAAINTQKGNSPLGKQLQDPFFDYAGFEALITRAKAGKKQYKYSKTSENMTGRGFVYLRSGTNEHRRALAVYYGDPGGHNQSDVCNINLYGQGTDLTPGLAYPDMTKRNMRHWWHDNTISHNTVYVDLQRQYQQGNRFKKQGIYITDQKNFAESPLAAIVDIDGGKAYPQLKKYRRTCALVNIDEKDYYVVDFFAVQGGQDHISSFHGSAGTTVPEGVRLTKQTKGTYAGPDIPYGAKHGKGLQYLFDVRKGTLENRASVEWQIKNIRNQIKYGDKVRLRATCLAYTPQEFVLAEGSPPQNVSFYPKSVTYLLRRTQGKNLSTLFISVYESYLEGKRRVKSIKLLPRKTGGAFSAALEIALDNGKKDIIIKCGDVNDSAVFVNGINLKGNLAIARYDHNKVSELMVAKASKLTLPDNFSWSGRAAFQAKVKDYDQGVKRPASILLNRPLPLSPNLLYPLWTDITPATPRADCNYRIMSFKSTAKETLLKVDAASFINCKNNAPPSLKSPEINWTAISRRLASPDSGIRELIKLLPTQIKIALQKGVTPNSYEVQQAFSTLLTSSKLANNPPPSVTVNGIFAKKVRERGINNLNNKDLTLYNYLILNKLFPNSIPAYPNFIYDFDKGANCVIPFNYYIKR